jgi:hypothetical protein
MLSSVFLYLCLKSKGATALAKVDPLPRDKTSSDSVLKADYHSA